MEEVEAYCVQGDMARSRREYASAAQYFERASRLRPLDIPIKLYLANALFSDDRPEEAASILEGVLRIAPTNPKAHLNLGGVYLRLGRHEDAITEYCQAQRLAPEDSTVHSRLGDAYRDLNWLEEAKREYELAAALAPDNTCAWVGLGSVHRLLGQDESAWEAISTANEIDPLNIAAIVERGNLEVRRKHFDEALRLFQVVLRIDRDDSYVLYNLGLLYLHRGEYVNAKGVLGQFLSRCPNHSGALYSLALAESYLDNVGAATTAAQAAIEADPFNINAYTVLRRLQFRSRRWLDAVRTTHLAVRSILHQHRNLRREQVASRRRPHTDPERSCAATASTTLGGKVADQGPPRVRRGRQPLRVRAEQSHGQS